jgi:hypothetical protein
MSALFQDESQQTFKLPTEVWRTILDFCVDQDQDFSTASRKVIIFVLSVLSKAFHNLTRKQTLPKSSFGDSVIPAFCCFRGYASLLQYAIDHGAKPRRRDGTEAIIEGHLDCLKVLEKSGSWKLDDDELHDAISCGQMHITQYLLSKGITLTQDALPLAVSSGQLEMVTLCQSSFVIDSYDGLGLPAVKSGSLAMVKFIEQYTPLKQSDLVGAALHGSIEIVQYYLDKGFNVDDAKLCTTAAYPNHREFLKFVIKRGAPFSIAVMRFAASRNYVDLLQEMQAKGCAWEISVVNQAASHGHLEALKFLVDNGCPTTAPLKPQPLNSLSRGGFSFGFDSDAETTVVAAQNGHLSCLQYLMERGAPWPKDIIQKSIVYQNKNQLGIVAYLHTRLSVECVCHWVCHENSQSRAAQIPSRKQLSVGCYHLRCCRGTRTESSLSQVRTRQRMSLGPSNYEQRCDVRLA